MKKLLVILGCIFVLSLIIRVYDLVNPKSLWDSKEFEEQIRAEINKPTGEILPEDLLEITKIEIYGLDIKSLDGIEDFQNLKEFTCQSCGLKDISALSKLKKLKILDLDYNKVHDISSLSELYSLEILKIYHNKISDLSALSNLKNLKVLVIGLNPVESKSNGFAPLAELDGLQIGSYADYEITVQKGIIPESPYENKFVWGAKNGLGYATIIVNSKSLVEISQLK